MTTRPLPRVLLVEDTPPLARVYGEYLRFEPIALETVETGEAAEFGTMTPHAITAIDRPAELIMICDRDGQRAHVHHESG